MEEKLRSEIEFTLRLLNQIPDDRKVFYNTGVLSIEVTKEEAKKLLEQMLEELKTK